MVKKTQESPSRDRLKQLLDYQPTTGIFVWKQPLGTRAKAGAVAGGHDAYGMWKISLDGRIYPAHYLAWLYVHNEWPSKVKHKNGKRDDNRIENLFVLKSDGPLGYKENADVSVGRLREVLDYDPKSGALIWRLATSSRNPVGSVAGVAANTGYRFVTVDGRKYLAHRLAWLHVNGVWPTGDLDHINRNRDDNRIENLRPASRSENMSNGVMRRDNKSGVKGVTWHAGSSKWRAVIQKNGKQIQIGMFDDIEEAAAAYKAAAERFHGEYANPEKS